MFPHSPKLEKTAAQRPVGSGGFALVIALSLMAFIVLLLLTFTTITRVETRVADNGKQQTQARQNALLALNIALGQLQKYAGPDQRVTATADLAAGSASGTRIDNGVSPNSTTNKTLPAPSTSTLTDKEEKSKGLSAVQAGTRFWTGVWGNFDAPYDIYQATPRPVFLNWLVSGNEDRTFTADVTGSSPTGKITASDGTNASILPSLAISPTLTNDPAITNATTVLTIGTNTPAVLLVGPNTAGTDVRHLDAPNEAIVENAVDRYVVAPLVDIKAPSNSNSNSNSNSASSDIPVVGRYAYWIGDEGVKAKYNLKDPYSAQTDPYADPKAHYRVATAQRNGLETMDGFEYYPVNDASLKKVISTSQVRLVDNNPDKVALLADSQKHFHDYTTTSRGVLADSQNGGLRKDLTYLLSLSDADFPLSGQPIIPTAYSPTQDIGGTTTYCPTWDWLKSFRDLPYQTGNSLDYDQSGTAASIAVQPASPTEMGVAPVISHVRLVFEGNIISGGVVIRTRLAVILGNPYPVSLTGSDLKIKFGADDYYWGDDLGALYRNKQASVSGFTLWHGRSPTLEPFDGQTVVPKFPLLSVPEHVDPVTGKTQAVLTGINQSTKSLLGHITFTLPPTINIPPGGQKIYSISTTPPNQLGNVTSDTDIILSEGDYPNVAYMTTAVPTGNGGWPAIDPSDFATGWFDLRFTDSGNLNISLLDASGDVITKHQHIDIIGGAGAQGVATWFAMPTPTDYKNLGGLSYYPIWPGQAVSTKERGVQLFADYNLRAANMVMPKTSMPREDRAGLYGQGFHTRPPYYAAPWPYSAFSDFIDNPPPWGYDWSTGTVKELTLFDVPRRDAANDGGTLLSLGFLQHANLTADDENLNVGHQPGAAFGNSRFNPFVRQSEVITGGANDTTNNNVYDTFVFQPDPNASSRPPPPTRKTRFFDMSYLLNTALWDSYYFSTLPQASADDFTPGATDLPNSRLTFTAGDVPAKADLGLNGGTGTDHSTSSPRSIPGESTPARYQMIEGAFNVNSTSIQAWKSILASLRATYLENPASSTPWDTDSEGLNAPFPRAVYPWANKSTLPDEVDPAPAEQLPENYAGFRDLTDDQLQILAEGIVKQVRMRGPFLSLAHFINRSLDDATTTGNPSNPSDPTTFTDQQKFRLSGALQTVIDDNTETLNRPSTDPSGTITTFTGAGTTVYPSTPTQVTNPVPNRLTGLPGWLSQADILQALGPVISARSDTFTIRAYGEVRDPLKSTTAAPIARAWCEATVQRCPDYVDSTDLPSETLGTLTSTNNKNFGRRFRVVSIRWLTPDEI